VLAQKVLGAEDVGGLLRDALLELGDLVRHSCVVLRYQTTWVQKNQFYKKYRVVF
jgi:hypothetical protein